MIYYEAFSEARKALNSEEKAGSINKDIISQGNFDTNAQAQDNPCFASPLGSSLSHTLRNAKIGCCDKQQEKEKQSMRFRRRHLLYVRLRDKPLSWRERQIARKPIYNPFHLASRHVKL